VEEDNKAQNVTLHVLTKKSPKIGKLIETTKINRILEVKEERCKTELVGEEKISVA
jgi:hypothetical protein